MNFKNLVFLSLTCLFLWPSCESKIDKTMIAGKWKAFRILEHGEPKDLDLNNVVFEFYNNKRYYYHDNLNTVEAGRYYIVGDILYTTDTTATNPLEKSVRIALISPDSLHFQMNAGGTPQIFELYKVK